MYMIIFTSMLVGVVIADAINKYYNNKMRKHTYEQGFIDGYKEALTEIQNKILKEQESIKNENN